MTNNDNLGTERFTGESPEQKENTIKSSQISKQRLWILTFQIKSTLSRGCAVVKSHDANRALRELLSSGMYNGCPSEYEVIKIEEIIESPDQMLICEEINDIFV